MSVNRTTRLAGPAAEAASFCRGSPWRSGVRPLLITDQGAQRLRLNFEAFSHSFRTTAGKMQWALEENRALGQPFNQTHEKTLGLLRHCPGDVVENVRPPPLTRFVFSRQTLDDLQVDPRGGVFVAPPASGCVITIELFASTAHFSISSRRFDAKRSAVWPDRYLATTESIGADSSKVDDRRANRCVAGSSGPQIGVVSAKRDKRLLERLFQQS